jgi:CRP-like cAMP-binding protein
MIETHKSVSPEVRNLIEKYPEYWHKIENPKGTVLVEAGDSAIYSWYVETGLVKGYINNEELGEEAIVSFFANDFAILTYRNDYKNRKSIISLKVLKDAVIHRISNDDWHKLEKENKIPDGLIENYMDKIIKLFIKREAINLIPEAEKRMAESLKLHSFLLGLPENDIASYLKISKSSVVRTKRKIRNRNSKK